MADDKKKNRNEEVIQDNIASEEIREEKTETEELDEHGNVKKRTKCEVYARVVGYIRPVQQWNEGKQSEFKDRKTFKVEKSD